MADKPIIWVHGDCLNPHSPAFELYPDAPAIFVWDDKLLEEYQISLKRIMFIYECLLELPVTIKRGHVTREIVDFARAHGADRIVTVESPSPRFRAICRHMVKHLPVEVLPLEPFIDYDGPLDLKRFSRYWRVAQKHLPRQR
jgi:hypothetical protein